MYIIKFNNNILHNVNYFFVALRFQNRITSSQLNIMTTHKSNKKKKLLIFTPFKKKKKKKKLCITNTMPSTLPVCWIYFSDVVSHSD